MNTYIQNKDPETRFNIVNAFKVLDPKRKLALCDQLFHNGQTTYMKTIQLLWPAADEKDAADLEHYLRSKLRRK